MDARVDVCKQLEDLGRQAQNHRTTNTHIRALIEDLNSEGHRVHYLNSSEKLIVIVKDMLELDFNIKKLYWEEKLVSMQVWDEVDKVGKLKAPKFDWRRNEMIPEDYYS